MGREACSGPPHYHLFSAHHHLDIHGQVGCTTPGALTPQEELSALLGGREEGRVSRTFYSISPVLTYHLCPGARLTPLPTGCSTSMNGVKGRLPVDPRTEGPRLQLCLGDCGGVLASTNPPFPLSIPPSHPVLPFLWCCEKTLTLFCNCTI